MLPSEEGVPFIAFQTANHFARALGGVWGSELIIIFIINYHFHNLYRSQAGEVAGIPLTPWRLDNLAIGI
jgi:hypothetical protein